MSNTIHVSNCPVCGAFPTQFVDGGEHGTSYCKFIGQDIAKAHAKTLLALIADSDVREYTDAESAAIRWLEAA